MKTNQIVTPSDQVDVLLPGYIYENYSRFVDFMAKSDQSEERIGFGQDVLQNLQKYRNFDTYKDEIVQFGVLDGTIDTDAEELTLVDGFGFPEENGVLLIDDEVILYRSKIGNTFYDLERGASGTTVLPTFRSSGTYVQTIASKHTTGVQVTNISVLFLVAMLENIHKSFAPNLESDRINSQINRSNLLQNIRDFFASKGSKLGIQSLFKILFGVTDVEVSYPGDRMIVPSKSSFVENTILRVTPFPKVLSDPSKPYTTPDRVIGSELLFKSFLDSSIVGRTTCEYVSAYPYQDTVQYEMFVDGDNISGNFKPVVTKLTRRAEETGTNNDLYDVFTITVESTIGFPNEGIIFIGDEGIKYTSRSSSQFLGCTRGYINVEHPHAIGDSVFGPFYVEGTLIEDGVEYTSRSWPTGLVKRVDVEDGGLLNLTTDEVTIGEQGRIDPRDPIMASIRENTTSELVSQANSEPNMAFVGDRTRGPGAVSFDERHVFVESSNLPEYTIGPFSTDDSVGPDLVATEDVHVIPRRGTQQENTIVTDKGTGTIGVAIDGVPFYSNVSDEKIVGGEITGYTINDGGNSYVNPTVVINPSNVTATATVVDGSVTEITGTGGTFSSQPEVRISSGELGQITLTFDNYGRIVGAVVSNPGLFYKDVPFLSVVDSSGRGRGAQLSCTVNTDDSIGSVTILTSGIDYNPSTTSVVVVPVGSGADVSAIVTEWRFDRVKQINDSAILSFDNGNGHIFEDENGDVSQFGYCVYPNQLATDAGETSSVHSPLIGWAWDGNPIYGPYGFTNNVDDTLGITKQVSGYVLNSDRSLPGSPSTGTYPLGSFVEDYTHDVDAVLISVPGSQTTNILDQFNGKVCNTPEFPSELYPDGVYCYFVSNLDGGPSFPYLIGNTWKNLPITQNIRLIDGDNTIVPTNQTSQYSTGTTIYDLELIDRFRNGSVVSQNSTIQLALANLTEGNISSVRIEDGLPSNSKAGDYLYFNNDGTGGYGAEATVEFVTGKSIVDGYGENIVTKLMSHHQRINLSEESPSTFIFTEGYQFTTSSGAECVVTNYDSNTMYLDVQVGTENLVQFGDTFTDFRGTTITIPGSQYSNNTLMRSDIVGGTSTFLSYSQPDEASPGDLWWSSNSGRLYVFYNDGDSGQWVTTHPVGLAPYDHATEEPVGSEGLTAPTVTTQQDENSISISTLAPSQRSDGSANRAGDLWWSSHTGILYIWNEDNSSTYDKGQYEWSGEWVITDPFSVTNSADFGVSGEYEYSAIPVGAGATFQQSVRVLISQTSPTTMDDGGVLETGALWWSPVNGKMYIYYTDDDSSQWVVCNPSGSLSSSDGLDSLPAGDGSVDYVSLMPETNEQRSLWFQNLKHFTVGDSVLLRSGAPGVGSKESTFTISSKLTDKELVADSEPGIESHHGSILTNQSKYLYTVTTQTPHGLRTGDVVKFYNSTQTGLDGFYNVVEGGRTNEAIGTAIISNGGVIGVTIDDPGAYYAEDTYVKFVGGGGQGAYGLANVDGTSGGVTSVTMINSGVNYTTEPTVVFKAGNLDNTFSVYTDQKYDNDVTLNYGTNADNVSGEVLDVKMISNGVSYESLPKVDGLYKRFIDRAETFINLSGTTIGSIDVISGGARYSTPVGIIEDVTGNGTGATVDLTVVGGQITSVTVTNPGSGYTQPRLIIIEDDGKYIPITNNIGKIVSYEVTSPGRDIPTARGLSPEILVKTRLIVTPTSGSVGSFQTGDTVYQGTTTNRLVTGTVVSYDDERQLLTLENVQGIIKENDVIYNETTVSATVLVEGQSLSRVVKNGISEPIGRFIDDTSKVSTNYAVTQDSEYFQHFSYLISSRLQQVQYETFVNELIHPAGFKMFSDLKVSEEVTTGGGQVEEVSITIL